MKRIHAFTFVGLFLASLLLAACGGTSAENSAEVLTQAAQIAIEGLTQTAAVQPTASPTEQPATPTVTATSTATPSGGSGTPILTPVLGLPTATRQQASGGSGNAACYRAYLETETIPDDTSMPAGKSFTKVWRLKNLGSCPWTANFSAVWVQGELMEAESTVSFTEVEILPGQHAMIEVDMQAPSDPGTYKGYWMLRAADGTFFGLGANGKEWFWVSIKVFSPTVGE